MSLIWRIEKNACVKNEIGLGSFRVTVRFLRDNRENFKVFGHIL